jgi:hypothetical protein
MTSNQASTSLSHGGGGTWGFGGGIKPSGIVAPTHNGGRSYRFQELFDAIQKINSDRSQVPSNADPMAPIGLVIANFLADPSRAVFDLRGLIDGGRTTVRATGVTFKASSEALNQAGIVNIPHSDALLEAAARQAVPALRRYLLGSRLRRICRNVPFSVVATIRAKLRMILLRWISPPQSVFDELEDIAWNLYGVVAWAHRCENLPMVIAVLHELAGITSVARKLHQTTPMNIGDAANTSESSAAESLAWKALHEALNALDDRTREQFLAEYAE